MSDWKGKRKWYCVEEKMNGRDVVVKWKRKEDKGKELWLKIKIGDDVWKGVVMFEEKGVKDD